MSMTKENDAYLTIRIPTEMSAKLKLLCISMSKQEGRTIGVSEFIRELLKPFIKREKQMTFFSEKK